MKNRCISDYSGTCKYYKDRGITVCDEWRGENGFINFYIWSMAHGYEDNLTIDRIDVNGNYEPSNCRWTTVKVQDNNKRNNRFVKCNGESHTIAEWSQITGIGKTTIKERLNRGWSDKETLLKPIEDRGVKRIFKFDKSGNLLKIWDNSTEISIFYNVHRQSVYNHLSGKRKTLCGFIFKRENEL